MSIRNGFEVYDGNLPLTDPRNVRSFPWRLNTRACVKRALKKVGTKTSLAFLLKAAADEFRVCQTNASNESDWTPCPSRFHLSIKYLGILRSEYRDINGIEEDARTHSDVPDRNMIDGSTNAELKAMVASMAVVLANANKLLARITR
jgi:hypothetical protein